MTPHDYVTTMVMDIGRSYWVTVCRKCGREKAAWETPYYITLCPSPIAPPAEQEG